MARDPFFVTLAKARSAMGEFRDEHKPSVDSLQRDGITVYRCKCSCGWQSHSKYAKVSESVKQAVWHLSTIADEYAPPADDLNGVSVPKTVGGPGQDLATG